MCSVNLRCIYFLAIAISVRDCESHQPLLGHDFNTRAGGDSDVVSVPYAKAYDTGSFGHRMLGLKVYTETPVCVNCKSHIFFCLGHASII